MGSPPDTHDQTPEGGAPVVGPDPVYLDDPIVDAVVNIVLELAAQMWVERERRMILENALASKGTLSSEEVEHFEPTDEQLNKIKLARTRFVNDVFKHLERVPIAKD